MPDTLLNPDAQTRRDIMAGLIGAWIDEWDDGKADTGHVATHIANRLAENGVTTLAVAQPEVNTVEELDALHIGSVIMPLFHKDKSAILKDGNGDWAVSGHPRTYDTKTVFLVLHGKGARVLYHPEVNDA